MAAMTITSSAFKSGEPIPKKYTGDGLDVSPPLTWSGIPEGTRELVLICDDPDAPMVEPWVHWIVYGISPDVKGLPEGKSGEDISGKFEGMKEGTNSWGKTGYGGPAPPHGHGVHHYIFTIYALDTTLEVPSGATKKDMFQAMGQHVLENSELVGTYER